MDGSPAGAVDPRTGRDTNTAAAWHMPRALTVLVATASAVVVAAGIQAAAWLLGPVLLALVIVITVYPVRARLRRWGLPSWVAMAALLVLVSGVLLVLVAVAVVSVARLAALLPRYVTHANELITTAAAALQQLGVDGEQLRTLTSSLNYGHVVGFVGGLLRGVTGLGGDLVFLVTLMMFLTIESTAARTRLMAIATTRAPVAQALSDFASGTRRFVAVTTVFGLLTGLVDTIALMMFAVPLAVLWGILAFITNYIPYIGFFIGLVPPALLALLAGGWRQMMLVIAVYIVVNFVFTSLVQPRFLGDSVGLSTSTILVALVWWGWLLGPLGAVLAVPLTLLVKLLLIDIDPRAQWADALVCSAPQISPAKGEAESAHRSDHGRSAPGPADPNTAEREASPP